MSVSEQITRIKTNIASAYTAAESKGATLPETKDSANLATTIESISGGAPEKKFGLDINNFIGNVDSSGTLNASELSSPDEVVFSGVKTIGIGALNNFFAQRSYGSPTKYSGFAPKKVSFPDVELVNESGLYYAFNGNALTKEIEFPKLSKVNTTSFCYAFYSSSSISGRKVSFPNLEVIKGDYVFDHAFYRNSSVITDFSKVKEINGYRVCRNLFDSTYIKEFPFPNLETVNGYSALEAAFYSTEIPEINFTKLKSINGQGSFSSAFSYSSKLTKVSFPALIEVYSNSFNKSTFSSSPLLTEIHFRADAQAVIEALNGYSDKWGATNATIYFDL